MTAFELRGVLFEKLHIHVLQKLRFEVTTSAKTQTFAVMLVLTKLCTSMRVHIRPAPRAHSRKHATVTQCSWPNRPHALPVRPSCDAKRHQQFANAYIIQLGEAAATCLFASLPHLKEHADDGHHRKPSVGQLCRQLFGLLSWVA